ncbi:MAG: WhiB family transcriptional regulator [Acidimicrobiales bacterium]
MLQETAVADVVETAVRLLPRWTQQGWMAHAACQGKTELFFPPNAERPQARARREAKARVICTQCAVQAECRSYARLNREYGYWGGESEEERALAGFAAPCPIGVRARRSRGESPAAAG